MVGLARRLPDRTMPPFDEVDWVRCDVAGRHADAILSSAMWGADAVVHLAWAVQPGRAARAVNRQGTTRVLAAAAAAGISQVVCCSSVAAYSPADQAVSEQWPCGGVAGSSYSRDKVWLERTVANFAVRHPWIAVAVVRPGTIVQPAAAGEFSRWLLSPLSTALLGWGLPVPLPVWRGLQGQVVHSDDLAAALRTIVDRRRSGPYNIAAAPVLSATDVADAFGAFAVRLPRPVAVALARVAQRAGLHGVDSGWLAVAGQVPVMDTTRARSDLDWLPRHDAFAALHAMVAAVRSRPVTGSVPLAPAGRG